MKAIAKKEEQYTYQDYLNWSDDERWEIIDGVPYNMTPSPTSKHQGIVTNFARVLSNNLINTSCKIFVAPLDVYFEEKNFTQPDVFVVCDKSKITEKNIQGAPDLIIEVLSPSTQLKDRREKRYLYERFGVKEYILVYPQQEIVERYILKDNEYSKPEIFNWDEILKLKIFDIEINLWEIFEKTIEKTEKKEKKQ